MPQDNLNWREKLKDRIVERYGSLRAYTEGKGLPQGTNPVPSGTLGAILYKSSMPLPDTARTLYLQVGLEELRYFFEVDRFPLDLKDWRVRKGYVSGAEASRALGVNASTYAEWESGRVNSPWQIKRELREKGKATGLLWFTDIEQIGLKQTVQPSAQETVRRTSEIDKSYVLTPERASMFLNSYLGAKTAAEKQARILKELGILSEDNGSQQQGSKVDRFTLKLQSLLADAEYFRNSASKAEIAELRRKLGSAATGSSLTAFLYELFQGGGLVRQ